jgi:pyruvate/2-oxoglutarate/acetoin dehydrogenase E1 component
MREVTYREAIREALIEEMEKDPMVFLLGEDIGLYGGAYAVTKGLLEKFGDKRVKDTPLSEAVIAGAAIGAAICGTRPVAEIMYIDFMTFCMDQIVNQAAKMRYMFGGKMKVPLVIRTQGGAGRFSAAQHSQSLEAWFVHVPGLKVVMPSTPHDAKGLLKSAIRDDNPVIFIEHKLLYNTKGQIPDGEYTLPLGKAEVKREGEDVTIVSYSRMALFALEAADELSSCGINPEVIDLGTLSPMDIETVVDSVKKTGRVIIVEEDCKTGGVGAEILSRINEEAFDYLDAPIIRIAAKDVPLPFSPVLENMAVPNKESIVEAVKRIV